MNDPEAILNAPARASSSAAWWLRLDWFAVMLAALVFVLGSAVASDPPVLWRHLSSGRELVRFGLPEHDPLTLLGANRDWANSTRFFDLCVYLVYEFAGDLGLVICRLILAAVLAWVLIVRSSRRHSVIWAVLPVMALPALQGGLGLSPLLPTLIVLTLWSTLFDRWDQDTSIALGARLLLVAAVWANISTSFLLGPAIAGLCWLGAVLDGWLTGRHRAAAPWFVAWLIVSSGVLVGSAGPHVMLALRSAWLDSLAGFHVDAEGQPVVPGLAPLWATSWTEPATLSFFLLLSASVGSSLRGPNQFRSLLPVCLMAVLATADTRFVPLASLWFVRAIQFSLATAWFGTQVPGAAVGRAQASRGLATAVWLAVLVLAAWFVGRGSPAELAEFKRRWAGTGTAQIRRQWLASHQLTGIVLPLSLADAGWVEWFGPQLKPVLDDRVDLFGHDYASYRRFCVDIAQSLHNSYRRTDGSIGGWRRVANVLQIGWIVSRTEDVETNLALTSSRDWEPVYWDAEVIIFGVGSSTAVADAAGRLTRLRTVLCKTIDGVPTLAPAELAPLELIMDADSWRTISNRELLGLARAYSALECGEVARFLLQRITDPRLLREPDFWPVAPDDGPNGPTENQEFVLEH